MGQQKHSTDQLPDNNSELYQMYYHNHRILQHGNFTGMIFFKVARPGLQSRNLLEASFNGYTKIKYS
jgi:hypothetical protein